MSIQFLVLILLSTILFSCRTPNSLKSSDELSNNSEIKEGNRFENDFAQTSESTTWIGNVGKTHSYVSVRKLIDILQKTHYRNIRTAVYMAIGEIAKRESPKMQYNQQSRRRTAFAKALKEFRKQYLREYRLKHGEYYTLIESAAFIVTKESLDFLEWLYKRHNRVYNVYKDLPVLDTIVDSIDNIAQHSNSSTVKKKVKAKFIKLEQSLRAEIRRKPSNEGAKALLTKITKKINNLKVDNKIQEGNKPGSLF